MSTSGSFLVSAEAWRLAFFPPPWPRLVVSRRKMGLLRLWPAASFRERLASIQPPASSRSRAQSRLPGAPRCGGTCLQSHSFRWNREWKPIVCSIYSKDEPKSFKHFSYPKIENNLKNENFLSRSLTNRPHYPGAQQRQLPANDSWNELPARGRCRTRRSYRDHP